MAVDLTQLAQVTKAELAAELTAARAELDRIRTSRPPAGESSAAQDRLHRVLDSLPLAVLRLERRDLPREVTLLRQFDTP